MPESNKGIISSEYTNQCICFSPCESARGVPEEVMACRVKFIQTIKGCTTPVHRSRCNLNIASACATFQQFLFWHKDKFLDYRGILCKYEKKWFERKLWQNNEMRIKNFFPVTKQRK